MNGYRDLRKLAAASIEKAAEVCGVAVGTIWNAEHAKSKLNEEQTAKLLEFYIGEIEARLSRIEEAFKRKGLTIRRGRQ